MSMMTIDARVPCGRGGVRRARQRGLSLVELMVALGLGAFITVGIIQMFTANRETYNVNMGQARLQENARFALEFLARPVRMTGFTGCLSDNTDILNVLNSTPYEFDFNQVIDGMNATGTAPASWSPSLDALPDSLPAPGDDDPNGIDTSAIVPGTDVLVLRLVETNGIRLAADMPASAAVIFTTVPDDLSAYGAGQTLMISDCEKAAVFEVQNSNVAGMRLRILRDAGTASPNSQFALTNDASSFQQDASIYAVETQIFFIAPGLGVNNRGDAPLSLWRKFSDNPPVELVEGIEDLQVLYGFDTDNDRVPNRYSASLAGQDTTTIVTIRVDLTANSVNAVTEDGDGLLRRSFSKTIALRNRISGGA